MESTMEIAGSVALVTGAGSGLGAATAAHLAALGARVAALDLSAEAAEATASTCGGIGLAADVSEVAAVEAAFAAVHARCGEPPRIVVNCAGIGTADRILPRDGGLSVASFERVIRINLLGSFVVMSVAARAMAAMDPVDADGARGVVVNTASVAYEDGQVGQAAYAASKGGIASMTLPAARELARVGIRVMTIAPGLFETAMAAGLPDETRRTLTANVPFPSRMGQPHEYALLVEQIVRNPMLNGSVIRLDGGVRMPPR